MSRSIRIAPTPSGYLHKGNAFAFLLVNELSRAFNYHIWLRIDDFDCTRIREPFLQDIFRVLDRLGIQIGMGPKSFIEYQSLSKPHCLTTEKIQEKLKFLYSKDLVYSCKCTRKIIDNLQGHPCPCSSSANTELLFNLPIRFRSKPFIFPYKRMFEFEELNRDSFNRKDFILWRREGFASYALQSVLWDEFMGVTAIVRGVDLWEMSILQMQLAQALELTHYRSIEFFHHPLVLDQRGNKLSKSRNAPSVWESIKSDDGLQDFIKQYSIWKMETLPNLDIS